MLRNVIRKIRLIPALVNSIAKINLSSGKRHISTNVRLNTVAKYLNTPSVKVLTLLSLFWPLKSSEPVKLIVESVDKVTLDNTVKEADQLFDNGQYDECANYLKSSENSNDVEVLWRISRVLFVMATAPGIENKIKEKLAFEAFDTASRALNLNDNHFAVHKWISVISDLKYSCESTKARIKNLEDVKMHMMRAAELNPSDATILYMIGEWCYRIADMPWYQRKIAQTLFASPPISSFEEALSYFSKAELMEPNFYSMNLLLLGKCYLKLGKEDAAKHYLLLALTYPARTNDDHQANKEAQDILKTLK